MAIVWKKRDGKPCCQGDENGPFHVDIGGMRVWIQRLHTGWAVNCDGLKIRNRTLDTPDKFLAMENALVVISVVADTFAKKFLAVKNAADAELKEPVAKRNRSV